MENLPKILKIIQIILPKYIKDKKTEYKNKLDTERVIIREQE